MTSKTHTLTQNLVLFRSKMSGGTHTPLAPLSPSV